MARTPAMARAVALVQTRAMVQARAMVRTRGEAMRRVLLLGTVLAGCVAGPAAWAPAAAQFSSFRAAPGRPVQSLSRDEPVTFTADSVQYDRENALVTASGNVEAWQGDFVLRADKVTFDRNTNVAAASGNVVLVEPGGQVLFADYAELSEGLRDGVLRGMRAILAENGKLVANGARRTGGTINELSRAVYSTCNLCPTDPTRPPLWQLRARSAVQDTENKRVEYRDAVLDFYGVPVGYLPYFWHTDPSVRRASGFLVPSFGSSSRIGTFASVPYYLVIDDQSDATITPTIATDSGPNLNASYRRVFNDGRLNVNAGLGHHRGKVEGDIFADGQFSLNDTWRYGFNINRASSARYLRDFRVQNRGDVLTSQIYLEGFGVGAYSRLDAKAYQGLTTSIRQSRLPYVLPRYQYSFFGEPDRLGGRFSFETNNFNVLRGKGTNTQRIAASLNWQRPFAGSFGEVYNLTLRADAAGYSATSLHQNPNYASVRSAVTARAQPHAALDARWPLVRDAGSWGTQLIEPMVQLVASPNSGGLRNRRIPNEDSLDFEFTDANLFAINRFPGLDRQEGGLRAKVALHGSWNVAGTTLDGLIGQSYRTSKDDVFPAGSGLEGRVSDVVTRATIIPAEWLDFTGRARFDHKSWNVRFADALVSAGVPLLRVTAGYIRSPTRPFYFYDTPEVPASYFIPRNEITFGASSQFKQYRISGYARRDLQRAQMTSLGARGTYEDECFIFDVNFTKRYTSYLGDRGATTVLFQITLKTVGQFGLNAF